MKVLKKIGIIAVFVGFMLAIGAIGNGDVNGRLTTSDFIHIGVGFALVGGGMITVHKVEEREEDEN